MMYQEVRFYYIGALAKNGSSSKRIIPRPPSLFVFNLLLLALFDFSVDGGLKICQAEM